MLNKPTIIKFYSGHLELIQKWEIWSNFPKDLIIDAKHKIIPNLVNKKDSANRHFLSFVVKVLPEVLPKTDNSVGIDWGIKTKASCRGALKTTKEINARSRQNEVSHYLKKLRVLKDMKKLDWKWLNFMAN